MIALCDDPNCYSGKPKLQPLVGEISWTKKLVIMSSCKDDLERKFYIRMAKNGGWSKDVLTHHIENQSYEKPCWTDEFRQDRAGTHACSGEAGSYGRLYLLVSRPRKRFNVN